MVIVYASDYDTEGFREWRKCIQVSKIDSRNELEKKTYIDLQRFQSYFHLLVSPIISFFMLPVYQIESSSSLVFCRADKISTIDSKKHDQTR